MSERFTFYVFLMYIVCYMFEKAILIYSGRYDPPSGWKTLLAPETERRTGPRSVGDEDNTDWLPLGPKNRTDDWSAGGKTICTVLTTVMGMAQYYHKFYTIFTYA